MTIYDEPCRRYPAFGGLEQLSEPLSPEEGNHVNYFTANYIFICQRWIKLSHRKRSRNKVPRLLSATSPSQRFSCVLFTRNRIRI